ncbi:unnamed protein product [Ilex paraguariensis]|uniref:Uncharacterized protein n=1 Tax=Ilex paraguariensis TaxID=185542 RepID=A0ABC8V2Q9_9AQUA
MSSLSHTPGLVRVSVREMGLVGLVIRRALVALLHLQNSSLGLRREGARERERCGFSVLRAKETMRQRERERSFVHFYSFGQRRTKPNLGVPQRTKSVCVRYRERERDTHTHTYTHKDKDREEEAYLK